MKWLKISFFFSFDLLVWYPLILPRPPKDLSIPQPPHQHQHQHQHLKTGPRMFHSTPPPPPTPPAPALPYKLLTIATDGIKISFTRERPKANNNISIVGCQDPDDDDDDDENDDNADDNNDNDNDNADEDEKDATLIKLDLNKSAPGLYPIKNVDFSVPLAPGTILVGVDPGQATIATFHQDGLSDKEHRNFKTPILGPFGLSTSRYHDLVGHRHHRHLMEREKRKKEKEQKIKIPALYTMNFKTADPATIINSFLIYKQWNSSLFEIHCSLSLARSRFRVSSQMKRFWKQLPKELCSRFRPNTIFCFGSAKFKAAAFKGPGSSPYLRFKRVLSSCFRVIDTPEFFTSQKFAFFFSFSICLFFPDDNLSCVCKHIS